MLGALYRLADVTYIGGGFNKSGIHNSLEAAVYGKPVVFGPNYQKFDEAVQMIKRGAAFSVNNDKDLMAIAQHLTKAEIRQKAGNESAAFVHESTGATSAILYYIAENRLLTK